MRESGYSACRLIRRCSFYWASRRAAGQINALNISRAVRGVACRLIHRRNSRLTTMKKKF
jgi:hypothetical protein